MWLECAVEVPLDASDITIGWFLNCQQLTSLDSRVNIQSQVMLTDIRRITSRLTINDLTEDYVGGYTCNILGDEEYIPSDLFMLPTSEYLEVDLALESACPDDGDIYGGAAADEKCADITGNITIPASLSCEASPITSSQQIHVTSTPILLTTSPSPSLTSLPSHLTSLPSQLTSLPSQLTTMPLIIPHYTLGNSPTQTIRVLTNDETLSLDNLSVYLIVVCSVLITIITLLILIFAIVIVKICRRKQLHNIVLAHPHSKPTHHHYNNYYTMYEFCIILHGHSESCEFIHDIDSLITIAAQVTHEDKEEGDYNYIQEETVTTTTCTHFPIGTYSTQVPPDSGK